MNGRLRLAAFAGLYATAVATASAQIDPGGTARGNEVRIGRDSAAGRVVSTVYEGRFSYVRIEQREPGADLNQHPAQIEPTQLRALLARLQLASKSEPLFTSANLDEIVPPLASALAKATPEQDVSFAVSGHYGFTGPLAGRLVTTARVFKRDDRLNVIVGLVRADFENQYRATGYLMPFEPGRRARPVDASARITVAGNGGSSPRSDWAVLALDAPSPAVPASAQPATPATPAAAASAPPPPSATAPSERPATPKSEAIYRETSERLIALKKLRDNGLISEQEYQEKRRQILNAL